MGEEILVYSENEKKWIGPLLVESITGRLITFQAPDGSRRQTFNADQIKRYFLCINFHPNKFRTRHNSLLLFQIYIAEIIHPSDPRAWKYYNEGACQSNE